jgi:hypothetical protein
MARHRSAGIAVFDPRDRDQHVGCAILVEDDAPPDAAAPSGLPRIEQQRVGAGARGADIVDRALPGIIFGPSALPRAALFEHLLNAVDRIDGNHQQRRRTQGAAADAQYLPGADAVELDAKRRDIAARPDLFLFHHDRGDDAVEHRIGQRRTVAAVGLAIELLPPLALRLAPALFARILRIVAGDVDRDAARQKIAAAVDRRDAAVAVRDLPLDEARDQNRQEQSEQRRPAPIARHERAERETGSRTGESGRSHRVLTLCSQPRCNHHSVRHSGESRNLDLVP